MKDGGLLEMIAGSLEIWASQVFQKQKSADFFLSGCMTKSLRVRTDDE